MELTCLIIDDEPHARELLAAYIHRTPGLSLQGVYAGAPEALPEFNSAAPPNLTFLDVDMPDMNGLDFASLVNGVTMVVFTTSFREYAPEAFEKNAVDYLLKPIAYPRFLAAVQKASGLHKARAASEERRFFFVKTELKGKFSRVNTADIDFIESLGNYVQLHMGKEKVAAYLTLGEVLEHLPAGQFARVHKSFVVALRAIRTMEQGQVKLHDGSAIPVGRAYSAAFMSAMKPYLLISKRNS
ncbi:LytR/AlgR family response regulator transcription factor [Mucilaginibacter pedocola]|uniref:DNA-binding response regulator n=1 Tax=Mucilaginibacter pedocola TaxID=1792845 RepID=A0A1S9PGA4_9SPHI|nr:LytTR family DNA-binding domain-containing protein [Mucilaginibacter pedocola]OOQ59990.1 hypothetical protein BC343_27045 [Mucilaginibacter pedocola]